MSTDGRNAQTPPRSFTICDPDPFSAGFLPSLPHSETTCSINTHCRQNRGNLTGQREREDMPGSMCVRVFASASMHLRAARAKPAPVQMLDIQKIGSWWNQTFPPWRRAAGIARYQTSYWRTNVQQSVIAFPHVSSRYFSFVLPTVQVRDILYLSTSRNSLSWWSGTSVRMDSSHSGIKHSHSGWLMTL